MLAGTSSVAPMLCQNKDHICPSRAVQLSVYAENVTISNI